jgi:hypothetical protein
MSARPFAAAVAFALAAAVASSDDPKKKPATLGEKVVAFCAEHKGKQVGTGQCADLASEALKAAGAKGRGKDSPNADDYTWGELVFTLEATPKGQKATGKKADIKAGDVVQFRDTKWVTRSANVIKARFAPHHTAVVSRVQNQGGLLDVYEQNNNGQLKVAKGTLQLNALTEGWIRVYRPQPTEEGK